MDPNKIIVNAINWVRKALDKQANGLMIFDQNSLNPYAIAAEICGVNRTTTKRVEQRVMDTAQGKTQGVKRKRGRKPVVLDNFQERSLVRIVLGFYSRNPPVLPTTEMVRQEAISMVGFPQMSVNTLRKLLKTLGFAYTNRDKKMHVYQRQDVIAQRHKYLHDIALYRLLGFPIYYQDETWVNAYHVKEQCWQYKGDRHEDLVGWFGYGNRGGIKVGAGKGKRLIVNHIGSSQGFLKNCDDVFEATKKIDFHDEMDADHWEGWLKKKVLPNIAEETSKAVIVIDNASYHSRYTESSKTVTTKNKKAEIQEWLTSKGIDWEKKDTVSVLLKKAKTVFVEKKYVVDQIVQDFSHANDVDIRILRLPVGHCDLNPIELIWAQVKNWIARNNTKPNFTAVKELTPKSLGLVTAEDWRKCVGHAMKVEDEWRQKDSAGAGSVDPTVISFNDEASSSDESNDEDDGDQFAWGGNEHEEALKEVRTVLRGNVL